jgi:hypothetical protein
MGGVVRSGGDISEIPGVEHVAAFEAGHPGLALASAVTAAQGAQAGFRRISTVHGAEYVVVFRPFGHEKRSLV